MNRYCVQCKWFKDGQLHHTYISPRCTVRGDDDCAYMRSHVCGLDEATLYEPKIRQTDLNNTTVDISTP